MKLVENNVVKKSLFFLLFVLFLCVLLPGAAKAQSLFLKVDGVDGQSTDNTHKNWIDVLGYKHKIGLPDSSVNGIAVHGDFVISKYLDIATPKLNLLASDGRLIKSIELHMVNSFGQLVAIYTLKNLTVTSTSIDGSAGSRPVEQVSFKYQSINWKYIPIKPDGTKDGPVETMWTVQ